MNKKLLFGLVFMFLLVMSTAFGGFVTPTNQYLDDRADTGQTSGNFIFSFTTAESKQMGFKYKQKTNPADVTFTLKNGTSGGTVLDTVTLSMTAGQVTQFNFTPALSPSRNYYLEYSTTAGEFAAHSSGGTQDSITVSSVTNFPDQQGANNVGLYLFNVSLDSNDFTIRADDYWDNSTIDEFKANVSAPDDYLVSYWNMNGNANDIIGGNSGTVNGATLTTGKFEQGYSFDGVNDNISVNDDDSLDLTSIDFSFTAWINYDVYSGEQGIIGKDDNSLGRAYFYQTNGNKQRLQISGTGMGSSQTSLTSGSWHFVSVTYDFETQNVTYYVNGTYDGSATSTKNVSSSTSQLILCGRTFNGAEANCDGLQDEIRIYNRTLTSDDVSFLYESSPLYLHNLNARTTNSSIVFNETYDQSGNNRTLTNNGATYDNGAYNFTGSGNLNSSFVPATGNNPITVLMNVFTTDNSTSQDGGLLSYGTATTGKQRFFRFRDGAIRFERFGSGITGSIIKTNTYQTIGYVVHGNNTINLLLNGLIDASYNDALSTTATKGIHIGEWFNGGDYLKDTRIKWVKIWDKNLSLTQIGQEQNETVYNWDNLVAYYPFQRISDNTTVNATVYKDNYLVSDQYQQYNTSNNPLTARLSESQISLNAQAIVTNSTISPANFTIEGQTFSDGELINISAGDYNVTFSKAGWYNKTQQITILPDASQTFTITDVYDAQLNLTYLDAQTNATIDTYTLTVENSTYSQEYQVTNESSYILNVLQNIDYDIIFTKSGYFSKTFNHFANQSFENISTVVTQIGDIQIKVFDLNTTDLMSTNVTLLVQNSTTEQTYSIQNGTGFIESLQQGQQYNLQFSAVGYVTNNYVFTYTNQSSINLYLSQGETDITFITQDSASSPLNDVEVKIERFVNGTYTVISLGETDIIGTYIANLQTGLTHRITFTKDNYITQSFITQLSELSYTVTLQTETIFDIAQGLQTVKTSFSPNNNTLYPNTVAFEINITNEDFNFEYYYARLKYNGTVLVTDNNTDAQGGTLNFNYNLLPFNNTGLPLVLEYGYMSEDAGLIISYHTYAVSSDENYSGSFLQLRDKLAVSLTILEKLSIFAFVFIVLLLMFSTMTTGLVNVVISSGIALLVGWVVGINLIILIIIFLLSTFIMLAYGSNRL